MLELSAPPNQAPVVLEDVINLDEFREKCYNENQGFQFITIGRDRFLERILGIFKTPNFNFKKKPKIEFLGEAGKFLVKRFTN